MNVGSKNKTLKSSDKPSIIRPSLMLNMFRSKKNNLFKVDATHGHGPECTLKISFTEMKVISNGTFGIVFKAKLFETNETVAIKTVHQDKRFKHRELEILKRIDHSNIVQLKYYFFTNEGKKDEVYLNLVLEYYPKSLYEIIKHYNNVKQTIPIIFVKLYMYQIFRALAYIHELTICHRDIKPQNILLDPETAVIKLCDFGSAKYIADGESNVSYICSRPYRAPELVLGATKYTTKIDMWSAGCVMAEVLTGKTLFPGSSAVDHMVEIIKILGTPTQQQIKEMNPSYKESKLPQLFGQPWHRVFNIRFSNDLDDLFSKVLVYSPSLRISPLKACAHNFFNELRNPDTMLPNGRELPPLFNFTDTELATDPALSSVLLPRHIINSVRRQRKSEQGSLYYFQ